MKIKVVTNELKFPIRILFPNSFLRLFVSKRVLKKLLKRVDNVEEIIDQIDYKALKQVFKTCKDLKGTELVNVKAKDGTEVKITL
ncbi:hypothetical protein [Gracilibacillus thailandensis]|jgi:hypothetical protein|uniref:Uncharacterized protein n=1 Tax=Gracilibacillus thailandensis TaxID=563735 RepID=A0A6N7R2X1_9BACI|nr:hypothetical protein [Gracilibacillus thailandensis]MRI65906.1 hypothetical protein [Gracilibacillus thailandensis]